VKRAIAFAALLFACALCAAQPAEPQKSVNEQARQLAERLGRERNVEGLETIVRARNVDLIAAYDRGLRNATLGKPVRPPLPAEIEAIIVRNYADPVIGGALRVLCTGGADYQTRALFDLFYAEWRSGKVRPSTYPMRDSVLRTTAEGVEKPLLDWVMAADPPQPEDRRAIIGFIGRRHYQPAAAPFIAMLRKGDREAEIALVHALVDIGGPEAIQAAIDYIPILRSTPPRDNADAWKYLAQRIAGLPASVPIPYKRFRAVLPESERSYSLAWLSVRKDLDAVPDALALMGEPNGYPRALDALVATDSPEVWKRARAEVERLKGVGRLNDGQYRYASRTLDGKIADPRTHFAEQRQAERNREYEAKRQALGAQRTAASELRTSPGAYIKASREHLAAEERLAAEYRDLPQAAVGLRSEVGNRYLELGHLARFKLKQPKEALELYEAAKRNGNGLGALAVADMYQFDLDDRAQAIVRYAAMRDEKQGADQTHNDMEAALGRFARAWLAHQVAYIEKGATFSGPVHPETCAAVALIAVYGSGDASGSGDYLDVGPIQRLLQQRSGAGGVKLSDADRKSLGETLASFPASTFVLMRAGPYVAHLPDANAILAFLGKHDPAGFASACYFSMAAGESPAATEAFRNAAARFNRDHKIVAAKMDPRMSTPEGTWNLLLDSLRKGDSATAMSCLTPGQQNKFRGLFEGQSPQEMRAMAESFTSFKLSMKLGEDMQEAVVTRGKQAE
jgi:hypothetical protein